MKKTTVILAALFGVVCISNVNAQNISFGVKADANVSNFILQDLPGQESKLGFGATLGGFAKFDIGKNFAVQPELLFHFKSSESELGNAENDYEYWGAEIPVYAVGQWGTGNGGRFYAGVGPYVGLGFSAKYKTSDIDLYDTEAMKRFDFGGAATLGYEFANGIQINAGYKIGFLDMMDAGRDDASMYNQAISLGVGFRF